MITGHLPITITPWHTPHPDLEIASGQKADPAWSRHSRWICQICLLGLMEMLSGKCNDLCGFVSVCLCVCVCPGPSLNPLFQLPCVCLGELSHFAAVEKRDGVRASSNLDSPFLNWETRGPELLTDWDRKSKNNFMLVKMTNDCLQWQPRCHGGHITLHRFFFSERYAAVGDV